MTQDIVPQTPDHQQNTLPSVPEMPTVVRVDPDRSSRVGPAEWALVAYAGAALGRIFPLLPGEILVGRAPECYLCLVDGEVSRHHALIRVGEGGPEVQDLGSTNGTMLNGELVKGPRRMEGGDRLAIGGHVLKLVSLDPLERTFHETLLDLSTRDPLTTLANRGCTLDELQNRFGLSVRYGRPLSVVACDIDFFKKINDTYGHPGGDEVLRKFGEHARATLREADLAGRIGGEEFLIILPETDLAGARPFAERLRKAVESAPVPWQDGAIPVTCSLGIAERSATDLEPGQLLARADAALYRAKHGGRNQVCEG